MLASGTRGGVTDGRFQAGSKIPMTRYDTNDWWKTRLNPGRSVGWRSGLRPLRVKIPVHDPKLKCRLVCRGNVMNVSRVGVLVRTRHQVEPNAHLDRDPDQDLQRDRVPPKVFVGSAEVMRVIGEGDGSRLWRCASAPNCRKTWNSPCSPTRCKASSPHRGVGLRAVP